MKILGNKASKLKYLVFAVIATSIILVSYSIYAVFDFYNSIYEPAKDSEYNKETEQESKSPEKENEAVDDNVLNILLVGVDNENGGGRSDTIILCRYHREEKRVGLISIPRDTRVKLPGRGYEKINHAYAYGGINYLKETLEGFLEVPIHNYVRLDFKGFKNIVDVFGGVEMYVEQDMYYYDDWLDEVIIDLEEGEQVLDGDKALQYVRWRGGPQADIGRVQRQQRFLKEMADEVLNFWSIRYIRPMAEVMSKNITLDFEPGEILLLFFRASFLNLDDVETKVLPGRDKVINGIWYWEVDRDEAREIVEELV